MIMYGNQTNSPGTGEQFVMDNGQVDDFRRGLVRVRRATNRRLTEPFQVTSSVEMTAGGQQGIITIALPGMVQMRFNVTPTKEMFDGGDVLPRDDAEQLGIDISAAVLSSILQQTDPSGLPAQ